MRETHWIPRPRSPIVLTPSLAARVLAGLVAGTAGTMTMSAVMLLGGAAGLMGTQPPRRVIDKAADEAGLRPDDRTRDAGASVLHLLIGAASGVLLELFAHGFRRAVGRGSPVIGMGAAFGILLWAANYLALGPALGVLPRADHDRRGRPPVMIAAHLVFGITTAVVARMVGERLDPARVSERPGAA